MITSLPHESTSRYNCFSSPTPEKAKPHSEAHRELFKQIANAIGMNPADVTGIQDPSEAVRHLQCHVHPADAIQVLELVDEYVSSRNACSEVEDYEKRNDYLEGWQAHMVESALDQMQKSLRLRMEHKHSSPIYKENVWVYLSEFVPDGAVLEASGVSRSLFLGMKARRENLASGLLERLQNMTEESPAFASEFSDVLTQVNNVCSGNFRIAILRGLITKIPGLLLDPELHALEFERIVSLIRAVKSDTVKAELLDAVIRRICSLAPNYQFKAFKLAFFETGYLSHGVRTSLAESLLDIVTPGHLVELNDRRPEIFESCLMLVDGLQNSNPQKLILAAKFAMNVFRGRAGDEKDRMADQIVELAKNTTPENPQCGFDALLDTLSKVLGPANKLLGPFVMLQARRGSE